VIRHYTHDELALVREIQRLAEVLLDDTFQLSELKESLKDPAKAESYSFRARFENKLIKRDLNLESPDTARKKQKIADFNNEIVQIEAELPKLMKKLVSVSFEEGKRFRDVQAYHVNNHEADSVIDDIAQTWLQGQDPARIRVETVMKYINQIRIEVNNLKPKVTVEGASVAIKRRAREAARTATNGVRGAALGTGNASAQQPQAQPPAQPPVNQPPNKGPQAPPGAPAKGAPQPPEQIDRDRDKRQRERDDQFLEEQQLLIGGIPGQQ